MADTYTREEVTDLHHAAQDIELFLRLATMRIEQQEPNLPFKPVYGRLVIGWLRGLAHRYAQGQDITK